MFCLLVLMCFGDKLNETQILEIQQVQREMLVNLQRFVILNLWPKLMKILLRKRWKEYLQLKSKQQKVNSPFTSIQNLFKKVVLTNLKLFFIIKNTCIISALISF